MMKKDDIFTKLVVKIEELEKRFDCFINNEFSHLRDRVDEIYKWIVFGVLGAILLQIIFKIIGK